MTSQVPTHPVHTIILAFYEDVPRFFMHILAFYENVPRFYAHTAGFVCIEHSRETEIGSI